MEQFIVALFGEAEKGEFHVPYLCTDLTQLVDYFGNPPGHSSGLFFAVQALLYQRHILFFRVQEEGFSEGDYLLGLHLLSAQKAISHIEAIGFPGVGDAKIINAAAPICRLYNSILLTTEADLFDYLTLVA